MPMVSHGMDVYYSFVIHPPFDGHLHSFRVFTITNSARDFLHSHFGHMYEYFSRMDPSDWNCWVEDYAYFNLRRSARLPSKNLAPIHTPAKTIWGCFPEHCCQHWGLSVILIFSHRCADTESQCCLACMSLITTDAEALFICLMATWISSVNCLLISFVLFST